GRPSGPGAYQDTFMPAGLEKRTEVRCAANGPGAPAGSAPTAATAPGGAIPGPMGPNAIPGAVVITPGPAPPAGPPGGQPPLGHLPLASTTVPCLLAALMPPAHTTPADWCPDPASTAPAC